MRRQWLSLVCLPALLGAGPEGQPGKPENQPNRVKVAAVQITGYTKQYVPRPGYDPVAPLLAEA